MRKPAKTAALLIGLGFGAAVGPLLGPAAGWSGVAIAAFGIALSLIGTPGSDPVADRLVDRDGDAGVAGDARTVRTAVAAQRQRRTRQRLPSHGGLGARVEQVLNLAEEQAEDHRAEARIEAERIVTAARREAEAILNRAHDQAALITGTRPNLSPAPLTEPPSPDESPSPHP